MKLSKHASGLSYKIQSRSIAHRGADKLCLAPQLDGPALIEVTEAKCDLITRCWLGWAIAGASAAKLCVSLSMKRTVTVSIDRYPKT